MGKLKQYWLIILFLLAISTGLFYWFQWRPTQIIKECFKYASIVAPWNVSAIKEKTNSVSDNSTSIKDIYFSEYLNINETALKLNSRAINTTVSLKSDYEFYFSSCLSKKGLK